MSDRSASRTAFGTAYMRAAHQLLDAPHLILDDPAILPLLGRQATERIGGDPAAFETAERRALRAHVVLRSRFAEDRLAESVARGVTQYVLLGAGLDTFAFRQPEWAWSLRITEVDQPASQAAKRALIDQAGWTVPSNMTLAPVDFEHETLADALARHGVSTTEPTFFSWLGVTMYLNEAAIDAVLATVAAYPAGSELVLTFARADGPRSPFEDRAAEAGEPWLSHFTLDSMQAKLNSHGFTRVAFLDAAEADRRYFGPAGGSLPVPRRTSIVSALI